MKKAVIFCTAMVFMISCKSIPKDIPQDLSAAQLFKKAQSEVINRNYKAAVVYYDTIIERFSNDAESIIVARYELALIHYKMGQKKIAENEFQSLINLFSTEESALYPRWVLVLSKKLLDEIQNPNAKKAKLESNKTDNPDNY